VTGQAHTRRALSNLLLGLAVGLLSYYALTSVSGWFQQRELRDRAADVPAFAAPEPAEALEVVPVESPLDFAGWEAEDQAYWMDLAEGEAFGRLVIPAIGLDAIVLPGTTTADLRKGPGWIEWTQQPGPEGTFGIAGHRTTYGAPFRRIGELAEGDTIDFYSPYRRYSYAVWRTLTVRPDQIEVMDPIGEPLLALSACHPPYSARYRLIVQAKLVEVQRLEQ
jgi:sortase A